MTYYVRIRSNLTGQILTNWKFFDASIWYYGKINAIHGGESEYIVELDIWNNEPSFNAGDYNTRNKDAYSCQLGIEPIQSESIKNTVLQVNRDNYQTVKAYIQNDSKDNFSDNNFENDSILALFKLDQPFLYGRCFSTHKLEEWQPISLNNPLTHIYGTTRPNEIGKLYGNADHCLIQTKLILPATLTLQNQQQHPFKLTFQYLYD